MQLNKINKWCLFNGMNHLRNFEGKNILNQNIIIKDVSFSDHQMCKHPQFLNAENVIITNCDKNYVYYYVDDYIFPKIDNLYLLSHPCDPKFFWRFRGQNHKVFLANYYKNYQSRWAPEKENLCLYNVDEFLELEKNFVYEDPKF